MATTDILGLDEISQSQGSKYVTHNEALKQLEAMIIRVLDMTPGGPPGAPSNGDTYVVDSATGDWSGASLKDIAYYYGSSWHFYTPTEGVRVWVSDEDKVYAFDGTNWTDAIIAGNLTLTSATSGEPILKLENTNADAEGPVIEFNKNSGGAADDDELGTIEFRSDDSGNTETLFGYITGQSSDVTDTDEAWSLKFTGLMNATLREFMKFQGYNGVVDQGEIIFNEDAQDIDLRIEAVGKTYALFIQGSDGKIGINESSPDEDVHIKSATSAKPVVKIENTNADALGAILEFCKDSGSPTNADELGRIEFYGDDLYGVETQYGYLTFKSADVLDAHESGQLTLNILLDGTSRNFLDIKGTNGTEGRGEIIFNEDGKDIDFRVEAVGQANAFFVRGSNGNVGINVSDPDTALEVFYAGDQLKLSFDGTDNVVFAVDTDGVLTITPSGAAVNFASKNLTAISALSATGNISFDGGTFIFNETGADLDFRVEGVGNANAFFVQGSDGFIGVGTDTPDRTVHLVSAVSNYPVFKLENQNADDAGPRMIFKKDSASPAANDQLGAFEFFGDDSGGTPTTFAYMNFYSRWVVDGDEAGMLLLHLWLDGADTEFLKMSGYNGAVGQGEIVFNTEGKDIDFTVESDTLPYAFRVQGSNGYVGINKAIPEAQFQVVGGAVIGDDTNDLLISTAGVVTMQGTAKRDLTLRADLDYTNITAQGKPTQVNIGVFHGYSMPIYNNDNEELFFNENVPGRWDGASDISFHILVALASGEDATDTFKFQLSWNQVGETEVVPATTTDVPDEITVVDGTQYATYILEFTIDYNVDGGDVIIAHDDLAARLRRVASAGTEIAGEIIVLDWHTHYTVDKMFKAPE